MGMALPMGGHLTHGWSVSATGKWFNAGALRGAARRPAAIDFDEVRDLARARAAEDDLLRRHRDPAHDRLPGASPRSPARSARCWSADIAHIAGLIAGGAHPSPVGHADVITTTTHKTLRGPRGAMIMSHRRARQGGRQGRVPRPAGRPAQPHHRRHRGRAAARPREPAFRGYAAQIVANARALAAALVERGLRPGLRRHRQPPDPDRPDQQGHRRQAGGAGAGPRPASS